MIPGLGFPCGSAGKESACNVGDLGSIPGLGRSPGEVKGYPVQYSGLKNSMGILSMGFSRQKYWSGVPLPSPDIRLAAIYTFYVK